MSMSHNPTFLAVQARALQGTPARHFFPSLFALLQSAKTPYLPPAGHALPAPQNAGAGGAA